MGASLVERQEPWSDGKKNGIEQRYIVSVENTRGSRVYLKKSDYSPQVTQDPFYAQQWALTEDKATILAALERFRRQLNNEYRANTVRIDLFEWEVKALDDEGWTQAIKEHALAKLTEQEIVALNLEKEEIFRRLKQ